MIYGHIKKLLSENYKSSNEIVLIESSFLETTRSGKYLRSVVLGLTNKNFAIASMVYCVKVQNNCERFPSKFVTQLKLHYLCPLDVIKIRVFKKQTRNSLKVITTNGVRYFQIGDIPKKKIYWHLWCKYTTELNSEKKLWPFSTESNIANTKSKCWADKYLYLGQKRGIEDLDRPIPIPGLGLTEEMKLSYIKPQYFGRWNLSENWVQYGYNSICTDSY